MKNILLPTDFSENSWNAIKYAIDFHADEVCNFYIIHVVHMIRTTADVPYFPTQEEINETHIKPAKQQLDELLKRIHDEIKPSNKHTFGTLAEYSFLIESIKKQVDHKKIDLIVMGTKGASGLKEVLMGSNTADVIKKVSCSTLVVPEDAVFTGIKQIAFPTDFSLFYHIDTLLPLCNLVYKSKANINILHVSKTSIELNNDQKNNKALLKDLFAESDFSFNYLKNKSVENAVQDFAVNNNIDLIVMIAKNLNYFQQIFCHTKVENISYHTEIPFWVLHE